jgi:hypothetical protein
MDVPVKHDDDGDDSSRWYSWAPKVDDDIACHYLKGHQSSLEDEKVPARRKLGELISLLIYKNDIFSLTPKASSTKRPANRIKGEEIGRKVTISAMPIHLISLFLGRFVFKMCNAVCNLRKPRCCRVEIGAFGIKSRNSH